MIPLESSLCDDNQEFMSMVTELGIEVQWGDPTDKRTDGFQEQAVKQIELTCKALLAENAKLLSQLSQVHSSNIC